jgi:hypothetical protein
MFPEFKLLRLLLPVLFRFLLFFLIWVFSSTNAVVRVVYCGAWVEGERVIV